jgi:hypothetical protein
VYGTVGDLKENTDNICPQGDWYVGKPIGEIGFHALNVDFLEIKEIHSMPYNYHNSGNYPSSFLLFKTRSIMKNGVFWVVTPCGSCKNRRFGGTWRLLHQGDKNR